jgi:osmotically inducible lipoprotein OsmB
MKRFMTIIGLAALVGGCATPLTTREKGALAGGALGAGAGAIIGNQVGHQGKGALIGGAIGALGGGLIGDQMEGQNQRQTAQDYELEQNRRELERQRREIDDLRRDRYDDRRYDDRRYDDRYYDQRGSY